MENEAFEMGEGDQEPHENRIIENMSPGNPSIISDLNDNFTTVESRTKPFGNQSNPTSLNRRKKRVSIVVPSGTPDSTEQPSTLTFEDLHHDPNDANILSRLIDGTRLSLYNLVVQNKIKVKYGMLALFFLLYNAYFITCIAYNRRNSIDWEWCDGHGLLIILTALVYWTLFYFHVIKRFYGKAIYRSAIKPAGELGKKVFAKWYIRNAAVVLVIAGIIAFIVIDAWEERNRMISAAGVVVMVIIGLIFSQNPGRVQWRQVLGGMAVQFILGLLVLRWEGGRTFLDCVSAKVTRFLRFSDDGAIFIYGYLASGNLSVTHPSYAALNSSSEDNAGSFAITTLFAFQALSVIYFFSFCVGLLYHIGVMTWVVMKVGWVLQILLGTTAAESMNASANIFLGQTEAPILIKPFLNEMTRSEIHAVMTGGFATIAGSVMAAYISFGVKASSLLTASVMAAPAALAFSKLLYPETQVSKTSAKEIKKMNTKGDGNALDAAAQAAAQGFVLIGNIIANIIAMISFIAFLNAIINWLGTLAGQDQLSFEWILGKIFIPFAYCLGIQTDETEDVALLLGLKLVVNEFVAYEKLLTMTHLSERSKRIAEYALCSFANLSSVGIQLGGLGALAPARRIDFSRVVWSALLAGTLTGLMNACVAGALISKDSLL